MARANRDMQSFRVFDFRKGLDLKTSPLQLALSRGQNSLTKADNMVYTTSGAATKRFDQATLTTTSLGATVAITGGREFRRSNGTSEVILGTNDGRLVKLNTDGTTTDLLTGLTASTKWWFEVYNDLLIAANRADAPRKYDGTTVALLGGSPPATGGPVRAHGNRIFFLDATQKSRLTWSALNDEEDYTTASNAGSVLVSANDGSDLIDMVPSINELVLLKGARPYRLQGTSPATFALTNVVPTTGSVGAASPHGNAFAANDVWYMANNGVVALSTVFQFGDLKERYASDRIAPYWEAGSGYTVSAQNLDDAVTCYDSQYNRLYFAVDSDGDGRNDTLLVYDLANKAWSPWLAQSIASLWTVRNASTGLIEVYAGGYDGHVRVLNREVSTNAIDGHMRHLSCLDAPGIEKSPRYLFLYLKEEGNYTVAVDTKFDFGNSGGQSYTASLLGGNKTLGVNWTLGVDKLGAKAQIVKRMDLSGVGEFLEIGVRNQNAGEPFTVYGFECMWRPRRTVRRGTAVA